MFERNFGGLRPDGTHPMKLDGQNVQGCFFGQSSFSNPAIVQEESCVVINTEMPLDILAPLGCGAQTGAGSIFNVVKPVENSTRSVAIFGIGGVGSAALMAAKAIHHDNPNLLTTIIAVDLQRDRLDLAAKLGATHTIQSTNPVETIEEIHRITKGDGVDAAVDCTGAVPVINAMIKALGAGGIAVTVGVPSSTAEMEIQVFDFVNSCKTYRGSHQGNSYSRKFLPFLADLYMQGRFPIDRLQKRYKPSEINTAVEDLLHGRVMKPVIVWT
ncbi:hypothetical protein PV10_00627 [Exophiala mesophila]|uniref:Alcohol dehydrogenase-like C-terminal domain-containing protein n=1 Tax=Exophiala mesophila TaxID=212818 RepID=A0A0D1Y7R5_EXOME|nr:uncharacterized protein PV10_00627 [Exophiala mesophila]KIV96811.1 hypothetical protein PV10_00627 [Exophiala mesophila]